MFAALHGIVLIKAVHGDPLSDAGRAFMVASTWRLCWVGLLYIGVMTLAAMFLSHRMVGPLERLEDELYARAEKREFKKPLFVREGDELESLINAINQFLE